MENPIRRKTPPMLDTLVIPDSPLSSSPSALATGVASNIFDDPDAWRFSISGSSDDGSTMGRLVDRARSRPPELFLGLPSMGPPSLTSSASSADTDSTSWDSVKSGELSNPNSKVMIAGAKSAAYDSVVDPKHASILRYISHAFPPPKIFSPVDVPASAAIPYTPISGHAPTSFSSPDDRQRPVSSGKSASATHFILKYYGVPETPRVSRHIPAWDVRSAGPELPPVPSLPSFAPSSPTLANDSSTTQAAKTVELESAPTPVVPQADVSQDEQPLKEEQPETQAPPVHESPKQEEKPLASLPAPADPPRLPCTPPRQQPRPRAADSPSATPIARTVRRPLPTVPQVPSREGSPSPSPGPMRRAASGTPPRLLPKAPVPGYSL